MVHILETSAMKTIPLRLKITSTESSTHEGTYLLHPYPVNAAPCWIRDDDSKAIWWYRDESKGSSWKAGYKYRIGGKWGFYKAATNPTDYGVMPNDKTLKWCTRSMFISSYKDLGSDEFTIDEIASRVQSKKHIFIKSKFLCTIFVQLCIC